MKKSLIILLSVIVLIVSGCSTGKNASIPLSSTAGNEGVTDKWEYEVYIDNIDYYMNNLAVAFDEEVVAIENEDLDGLEKAYKKCILALEDFYDIPCPDNIKAEHDEFMTLIESDKKGYELILKAIYYEKNFQNLTNKEQEEFTELQSEIDEHFSYTDDAESINLWDAKSKVTEAASKFI